MKTETYEELEARCERIADALIQRMTNDLGWEAVHVFSDHEHPDLWRASGNINGERFDTENSHRFQDGAVYALYRAALEVVEDAAL